MTDALPALLAAVLAIVFMAIMLQGLAVARMTQLHRRREQRLQETIAAQEGQIQTWQNTTLMWKDASASWERAARELARQYGVDLGSPDPAHEA